MVKKCIICDAEAKYKIKDTPDYYCQECAEENFSDLTLLVTLEDEAQRLREYLKEKVEEESSRKNTGDFIEEHHKNTEDSEEHQQEQEENKNANEQINLDWKN